MHESLTPWKHQSTSPPFEKMVKKSSMTAAGEDLGPRPAPGTLAASAAASCCAKRGTRHTSSPRKPVQPHFRYEPLGSRPFPAQGALDDVALDGPIVDMGGTPEALAPYRVEGVEPEEHGRLIGAFASVPCGADR